MLGRADAEGLARLFVPVRKIVADFTPVPGGLLTRPSTTSSRRARPGGGQARPPAIGERPNDSYYRELREAAARSRAGAVLFRSLRFCDECSAEQLRVKAELARSP